jgi:hypothetical protein
MLVGGLIIALLAGACVGWGALTWSLVGRLSDRPVGRTLVGELGLIGILTIGALATALHFVVPLGGEIAIAIGLVGLAAGGLAARRGLGFERPRGRTFAALGVIASALAASGLGTRIGYDAGLYHLPVQQWIREEPIVIGFANLHHRFGFNSMHEVLSSLLWLEPGDLRLITLGEQLYVFFVIIAVLETALTTRDRSIAPAALGLLAFVSFAAFNDYYSIAITFNDNAVGFLFIAVAIAALRAADASRTTDERRGAVGAVLFLSALAVALKASAATLIVLVVALLVIGVRSSLLTIRAAGGMVGVGALMLLPTVVRGYLMSGCLAFPSASSCVGDVSFSASEGAEEATDLIVGWARTPHTPVGFRADVLAGREPWIDIWWERTDREIVWLLMIFAAISIVTWLISPYLGLRRERHASMDQVAVALVLTEVAALGFWWTQAPDTRFGIGALHLATVLPAALALRHLRIADRAQSRLLGAFAVPIVVLAAFSVTGLEPTGRSAIETPVFPAEIEIPEAVVVPNAAGGVRPEDSDQCWLTPSPCVPFETEFELDSWGPYTVVRPVD